MTSRIKIQTCKSNSEIFPNSLSNDMLLYSTNSNTKLILGIQDSAQNVCLNKNNVSIIGNIVANSVAGNGSNISNISGGSFSTGILGIDQGGIGTNSLSGEGVSIVKNNSPVININVGIGSNGYLNLVSCGAPASSPFISNTNSRCIMINNRLGYGNYEQINTFDYTTVNNNLGSTVFTWSSNTSVLANEGVITSNNIMLCYTRQNRVGINKRLAVYSLDVDGGINASVKVYGNNVQLSSDDRVKVNEEKIESALENIMKLRPQMYTKLSTFEKEYDSELDELISNPNCNSNIGSVKESGLIAQEVFYAIPEWRHLIEVASDHDPIIYSSNIASSINLSNDPKEYYKYWGSESARLNYIGLLPYLIKGVQELKTKIDNLIKV